MSHKSELELLAMESKHVSDQSLESTRRMIVMCDESKGAGIMTLVALDEQGEQLDKIEKDMDRIRSDMEKAEQNINQMEGWCARCVCPCGPNKVIKDDKSIWKSSDDGLVIDGQPRRVDNGMVRVASAQYVTKISHDDRELEMEKNLSMVDGMVGTLRSIAIDMRDQVVTDESKIQRIGLKAQSDHQRIKVANDRTNRLTK